MKKYVITNDTEITEKNVNTWITDFTSNIQPHLLDLDSYYQGTDDIKKYPFDQKRIDNDIHINLAYMTVQNVVSYCFGKAPTQDYHQDFKYGSYIEELKYKNKDKTENKAIENSCSKYGLGYEYIGVREINGVKEPFYKRLDPLTSFVVKDDSILEETVCFITYTMVKPKNGSAYMQGYVYIVGEIIPFDCKTGTVKFGERKRNVAFKDKLPVVLYKNNDDMCGDYEKATEILSAYSKLYSVSMDDHESIANALLLFYNTDLPDEEKEKLNRSRVAALMGDNVKAEYIYKKLDSASFNALKEGLRAEFYAITNLADFTDVTAYNKSASAILYKLVGMENIRVDKSAYFEEGMRERWDIISSYVAKPFKIKYDSMTYSFYNNLPANIENDLAIMGLVERGGLSLETALKKMENVEDAENEYKRILTEKRRAVLDVIKDMKQSTNVNLNGQLDKSEIA